MWVHIDVVGKGTVEGVDVWTAASVVRASEDKVALFVVSAIASELDEAQNSTQSVIRSSAE